jgi:hypothetical protein
MFGKIIPDGTRIINPDELAKMREWYASRDWFEDQLKEEPMVTYYDVPAKRSDMVGYVAVTVIGALITIAIVIWAVRQAIS